MPSTCSPTTSEILFSRATDFSCSAHSQVARNRPPLFAVTPPRLLSNQILARTRHHRPLAFDRFTLAPLHCRQPTRFALPFSVVLPPACLPRVALNSALSTLQKRRENVTRGAPEDTWARKKSERPPFCSARLWFLVEKGVTPHACFMLCCFHFQLG